MTTIVRLGPARVWCVRCVIILLIGLSAAGVSLGGAELKIGLNFTGSTLYQDSERIPPDTMGAVGPDHIVELINGRYSVYRKTDGVRIQTSTLNDFWIDAGIPVRQLAFDPRVLWDPQSGRWFASSAENPRADGTVLIGVSRSADPTEGWSAISVAGSSSGLHWFDFPMLGIDADSIFVSVSFLPVQDPSGGGRVAIIVPKEDLLADARLNPVVTTVGDESALLQDPDGSSSLMPDTVPDDARQGTRQVTRSPRFDPFAPSSDVRVTKLLGLPSKRAQPIVDLDFGSSLGDYLSVDDSDTFLRWETIVSGPILFIFNSAVIRVEQYGQALLGRQPPPKASVEIPLDQSFRSSIVRRNATFWGAHTVGVFPDVAVRWFQIDADANLVLQEGVITRAGTDFYYPSIAVNDAGHVVIGFNGSGPTEFIGSYAVLGETVNGITTFGSPQLLQAGLDGYEVIRTANRNRWGDYSATVVDPEDPEVFWTFQEYVSAEDVWSTRITKLIVFFDQDGDGVGDDDDACPTSDTTATVVIDGRDSGTGNRVGPDGCTIADEVARCAAVALNHGGFVSCVADLTNDLKQAGEITGSEKGAIQRCAARARIP